MRICVDAISGRCCDFKVVGLDEVGSNVGVGGGVPDDRSGVRLAVDDESVGVLLCVVLHEGVKLLCHGLEGLLLGAVSIALEVVDPDTGRIGKFPLG